MNDDRDALHRLHEDPNDQTETGAEGSMDLIVLLAEVLEAIHNTKKEVRFVKQQDVQDIIDLLTAEASNPNTELHKKIEAGKLPKDIIALIETKMIGTDPVTGLPRREKQTELLLEYIAELQKHHISYDDFGKGIGFITFDVRGLKMVNDVSKDHKVGDAYLREIADHTTGHIVPFIQAILGEQAHIHVGRDGGDEISLVIKGDRDLTQRLSLESFLSQMPEGYAFNSEEQHPRSLLQWINTFIEYDFAQKRNNHISQEKLKEAARAGADEGYEPPEEIKLMFYVASGCSTLYDVAMIPEPADFKEDLEAMAEHRGKDHHIIDPKLPEEQKAKRGVEKLLSAMRSRADRESNDRKESQNKRWKNSTDPHEQFLINILSRNSFTIEILKELRYEKNIRKETETTLSQVQKKLSEVTTERDLCLAEKIIQDVRT